jgi:serine/threonine protein kinase
VWVDPAEPPTPEQWECHIRRWHVTLVDFGFARALTPADMKKPPPPGSTHEFGIDSSSSTPSTSRRGSRILDRSLSRRFGRSMSALGNRVYAAPEIVNHVTDVQLSRHHHGSSRHHPIDVTKTLSEHVSHYGLMADAYSVGNTLKYMLTGASPDQDVNDAIAWANNPVVLLFQLLCGSCSGGSKGAKGKKRRKVQYRRLGSIPKDVVRLVKGLTHPDSTERLSIRTARLYPWINGVLDTDAADFSTNQEPDFLSFAALHREDAKEAARPHQQQQQQPAGAVPPK